MRPKIVKIIFLFLCFVSMSASLSAQTKPEKKPETKQVHIEMTDGNFVDGKLIARRGDTVVVESPTLGTLNLNIKNIKNIDALTPQNFKDGKFWFDNIHAPHGFFAPTGFNLRKGEGYYGNVFLFFHQVGYGFSDNFSISGGTELITLLFNEGGGSSWPQFLYLNPKFSFQADKSLTVGVGMFLFFSRGDFGNGNQTIPFPYAVATFGNRNNNLSLGLGAGVSNGSTGKVLTLSGQGRLTRGISLMSENYFGGELNIGTTGLRFMNTGIAFNVGFMYTLDNSGNSISGNGNPVAPFPFLGLSAPFGSKKK